MSRFIGNVSAYAYAVSQGYTGTEEEYAELMASYATVAEQAAESAESASTSAQTATTKASEASTAAQTATAKSEEAQADADAAALDASQALSAASTATTKASEAAQSASDAATAKTAAQTAQTAAEGSAITAQTAAQTATTKAAEAAESARTLTIDPTLTQSGQAADSKVVGDEIEEVKDAVTTVDNAVFYAQDIIPKAITSNHYLKGTGVAGTSTTCDIYKYAVTAGDEIHIKASKDSDGVYQWQNSESISYSSTSAVVGEPVNIATDRDVVVPAGATFLMVSRLKTNTTNRVYRKKSAIEDIKSDMSDIHIMTTSAVPTVQNSRVMHGGSIESSQASNRTEYIAIPNACDRVKFKASGYSSVDMVSFFDASNTYISGIEAVNEVVEDTVAIPSGAKKVILSSTKIVTDAFIYVYSSQSILDRVSKIEANAWNIKGRNILIFGDSVTDCCTVTTNSSMQTTVYKFRNPSNSYTDEHGDTVYYNMWAKIMHDICAPNEVRNYALSGASYKHQDNTRLSLDVQIDIAVNDLNNPNGAFSVDNFDPDIIIFALGTNDGAPNDTPASAYSKIVTTSTGIDVDATLAALDKSKYCEAVLYAYMMARKYFPLAMIFCSLPLQRMSSDDPIGAEREYLKEIAQRFGGAIIIDACFDSGIVKQNNVLGGLGVTLKDGLHPNEKGQNLLARAIISSVNRHYMPFGDGFN